MTHSTLLIWCCCFHCHVLFYFRIICHAMTMFCSVLRTHVVMSAICIFGVVSLFSVHVLHFSCSLLSVEDEFLLSWDFRYYCVKNKKSFPFRWISSCCEESLANTSTAMHVYVHIPLLCSVLHACWQPVYSMYFCGLPYPLQPVVLILFSFFFFLHFGGVYFAHFGPVLITNNCFF